MCISSKNINMDKNHQQESVHAMGGFTAGTIKMKKTMLKAISAAISMDADCNDNDTHIIPQVETNTTCNFLSMQSLQKSMMVPSMQIIHVTSQ